MLNIIKNILSNRQTKPSIVCPYKQLKNTEVEKLLGDRVEFKLWSCEQHQEKLVDIETHYGGIMGVNRIYAENELDGYFAQIIGAKDALLMLINEKCGLKLSEKDVDISSVNEALKVIGKQDILKELNKLGSDTNSWYWILNEYRNKSIHRNILTKKAAVNINENINNNTSSSTVRNYLLLPPDYKNSMNEEIIVYLSDSIQNMKNLIENIKTKAGI